MADVAQIIFTYKEVAEALVKAQGLHEGIWSLTVNFGLKATNVGESDADLHPSAIALIMGIGLQRQEKETNLTVDAAKVNPFPKTKPKSR